MSNSQNRRLTKAILLAGILAYAAPVLAQNAAPVLPGVDANGQPEVKLAPIPKGATLEQTAEQVKNLSSQAGKTLKDFMGNAAIPRNQAEVEALADRRRNIMMLELMTKEAELVQKLTASTGGAPEEKNEIEELKAQNEELKTKLEARPTSSPMSMPMPDPVVSRVVGMGSNLTATILMVNGASVNAKVGTQLPNNWRVVSISVDGVTAQTPTGDRKLLGFGSTPPSIRAVGR